MGSKLKEKARMNSLMAVQEFVKQNKFKYKFQATVIVEKSRQIIFKDIIDVVISDNMNYYNINITWEDTLEGDEDYHDLGLFGYYSTDYCNMTQGNGILVISSDNGIKITIVC